jgi:hypothetical protein
VLGNKKKMNNLRSIQKKRSKKSFRHNSPFVNLALLVNRITMLRSKFYGKEAKKNTSFGHIKSGNRVALWE